MGNEIGHFREWDERREQDWNLLEFEKHQEFARFMQDLNHIYLQYPAFWKQDYDRAGFVWIDCHQEEKGVYIFKRMTEEQTILVAMNCSEKEQEYELKEEDIGNGLQLLLDSDWDIYGGSKLKGEETAAILKLAPFSAKYYFRK